MEKTQAEPMKEFVNSQNFNSTTEIMEAMKGLQLFLKDTTASGGVQRYYISKNQRGTAVSVCSRINCNRRNIR
ncbi:MAG: hypothetical protein GX136_01690 [Clostridiales bacterium]|jgi:hypothetical protein|nr:hypothetical protein [Clostridiales bacterium]